MLFRFLFASALTTACVFAQLSSFPKPSYFRETFIPPSTTVELKGPVRLQDFVVGGKLELSLKSYLELVMANNTDIQIQMLTLETPKNAIMRAMAPWDPLAQASFTSTRTKTPSTDALQGASTLESLSQPARFSFQQTLDTGTQYTVSFSGSKSTTNSGFTNFNPALNSSFGINFTQPLIKNRGRYVNRLNLMMARSRYRKSEYDLRNTLTQLVSAAENAYWDVVQAQQDLQVQQSARDLAAESLKRSQRELELGALSPLDIYNPQQQLATAELNVSQAKFVLAQREDALRKQMGADLSPDIRKLPITLTETVAPPTETAVIDPEEEVQKALTTRPDLKSAMQNLDVDDLSISQAKNGLLPDLSLTASYTTQGRGGIFYQRTNVFDTTGATSQILTVTPGGLGDSFSQMFGFGFPVYAFGLNLRLPIKSHSASADMADALVAKRRDALEVRTVRQQVRLDVLNAVTNVESSRASVKLAIVARDFAQKYLDAENKKYELGTETVFFVLQAQNALVQAESAVVQNSVNLRRNMLNLLSRTGELLDQRGIVIQ
ncbi:MAG TPA: TolC family protein [Bryobacteraceae bacterium]|nr:TolC family protein [Bryobacteraceae bacterium]